MAGMHRWNRVVLLLATFAIAALPLFHNHSLIPDAAEHGPSIGVSSVQCAICATRNIRVPLVPPSLEAPVTAEVELIPLPTVWVTIDSCAPLVSRAPPRA